MTLTSLSDLVSAIAQVSASNIKIQRAGALKAVKAARIIPSADLERWPVPVKSCRQAVPGLSWVDAGDSHGKAVRCGG